MSAYYVRATTIKFVIGGLTQTAVYVYVYVYVGPTLAQRRYCRPDVSPTLARVLAQSTLLSGVRILTAILTLYDLYICRDNQYKSESRMKI